jgi:hypothetical protein
MTMKAKCGDHLRQHEEECFVEARAGDHLMTPFQCVRCHFQDIYAQDPITRDLQDEECLEFIRRAVIDAFWSREQSTVKSKLYEAKRGARSEGRFGFSEGSGTPPMGPFHFEMKAAMMVLDRSLDPGKYADYVQWETFRKAQLAVTNLSQASVSGLHDVIGSYERNRCWVSKVPAHTFWFHRFMVGVHKRVGGIRRQDEAMTIDVLHEVNKIL